MCGTSISPAPPRAKLTRRSRLATTDPAVSRRGMRLLPDLSGSVFSGSNACPIIEFELHRSIISRITVSARPLASWKPFARDGAGECLPRTAGSMSPPHQAGTPSSVEGSFRWGKENVVTVASRPRSRQARTPPGGETTMLPRCPWRARGETRGLWLKWASRE